MGWTEKSYGAGQSYRGRERFQHWYRDNQVYFLTVVCADKSPGLWGDGAKAIFWKQFDRYAPRCGFEPWVVSVLDDHWHAIGWLAKGDQLPALMKGVNGATAKLLNDYWEAKWRAGALKCPRLEAYHTDGRLKPFWGEGTGARRSKNYFDGCLRDEEQGRRTHRYVCIQSERHGASVNWRRYKHTRVFVDWERARDLARERAAWLEGVRYKRYTDDPKHGGGAT